MNEKQEMVSLPEVAIAWISMNDGVAKVCGLKPQIDKKLADEIYMEVDGYYVFSTDKGYLNAHYLRQIADELDRRNAEWNEKIQKEAGEPK